MGIKEILEIIITATDKASGKLETVGSSLGSLGKGVATAGAAITGATAAIGLGALKLATDAAPLVQVQGAFEGLTATFEGGSDAMIKAMQEGSAGMVSNAELMKSYNSAAQLVGTTFANQLPDAMGYLGKVAGATGEDMGFMIDSLVKGVGRMSPMILDNLGIQVTLADATANASAEFGKQADELSKTELQAGMMNVVLEKLAENTKNMPELAGSATAGFEGLKATFTNVKDELGVALLPLFQELIEILKPMIDEFLPKLVGFIQGLTDKFSNMSPAGQKAVLALIGMVGAIGPLLIALGGIISMAGKVATGISAIQGASALLGPALGGVGTAITGTVLPALGSVLAAALPVIAVIAAIGGVVALFVIAWKRDWGGVRTTWTENWKNMQIIIEYAWGRIVQIATDIVNGIKDAFHIDWSEIGSRIVEGIANGIRNGIQWVVDAAMSVAQAAVDAAKNLLGIHSPSSVMEGIGSNMMAGWSQGITQAQTPVNSAAASYSSLIQSYTTRAAPQVNISVGSIDSRVDVDELAWKVIDRIRQVTGG